MFTLQFTAVNNSPGQRIILQVVLIVFKQNNCLWLYIDSQLILRIVNYETTRNSFVFRTPGQITCEMFVVWSIPWPSRRNEISGSIWHKLFNQTVEIVFPFFNKGIVYLSVRARRSHLLNSVYQSLALTMFIFFRKTLSFGCTWHKLFVFWRWDC